MFHFIILVHYIINDPLLHCYVTSVHYNSMFHCIVNASLHYSGPKYMYCFVLITCTSNTCENSILNSCPLFTFPIPIYQYVFHFIVPFHCIIMFFSMVNVPLNCSVPFFCSISESDDSEESLQTTTLWCHS